VEWVSTCLKEGRLVPEEPYRLTLPPKAPEPQAEPSATGMVNVHRSHKVAVLWRADHDPMRQLQWLLRGAPPTGWTGTTCCGCIMTWRRPI
jgi:hypothetical protein